MLSLSRRGTRRFRRERGATDPILVVAGIAITLVLLLGGTFAVTGLVRNAQDLNAKQDLDRVVSAQAAVMTAKETYMPTAVGPKVLSSRINKSLLTEQLGVSPGEQNTLVVAASGKGWAAMAQSASGATFLRTSSSNDIVEVNVSNIRNDFNLVTTDGTVITDTPAGSATSVTAAGPAIRFPAGLSTYAMAWNWVDALYGLDKTVTPPPGPNGERPANAPGGTGSTTPSPTPTPTQSPSSPAPAPSPSLQPVVPAFQAGPGDYELKSVVWNQMSATQVCVDLTVRGTGGTVNGWYLTMNAGTAPFNNDFNKGNYQFPTWGYGFDGEFSNGTIKVIGQNISQWNNFSTLTNGQERTFRICNYNTPKPPVTSAVTVTKLSEQPGEYTWNAQYRISAPDAKFYTAWKVQIDISAMNSGYKGSQPIYSDPGANDLKITQVSPNIIEVEGIGWPTMGVRSDKTVDFRIGR